jgi:hypothetical protein
MLAVRSRRVAESALNREPPPKDEPCDGGIRVDGMRLELGAVGVTPRTPRNHRNELFLRWQAQVLSKRGADVDLQIRLEALGRR